MHQLIMFTIKHTSHGQIAKGQCDIPIFGPSLTVTHIGYVLELINHKHYTVTIRVAIMYCALIPFKMPCMKLQTVH